MYMPRANLYTEVNNHSVLTFGFTQDTNSSLLSESTVFINANMSRNELLGDLKERSVKCHCPISQFVQST